MSQSVPDMTQDTVVKQADTAGRRTRLREFQAQLVERMQAARSGVDARVNQLGVMIGANRCLLNLQQAGEIVPVGAISPVPLTQDWFLGLCNIRGNLISVVDFARFQGFPSTPVDKDCRIVAFAPELSFNAGVLVSRVLGLRNVAEMDLQTGVAQGQGEPWLSKTYVDRESNVWTELDLSMVAQDPKFLHVGL